MPFTKTFGSGTGAWTTATAWAPISLRTPSYTWTASGSGTNEYYVRLGTSDPGFVAAPGAVWINGASAATGTLGSLTAGQWAFGDNDTLGYSTVYVRLSDGTDPDTKALNFVVFYQVPQAGERVIFDANSGSVTSGLEATANEIAGLRVLPGSQSQIASSAGYLLLNIADGAEIELAGNGIIYLDLLDADVSPRISATASAPEGEYGVYLRGSALDVVSITGTSSVAVAMLPGDTATAATIAVSGDGARVAVGSGSNVSDIIQLSGTIDYYADFADYKGFGGTFNLRGSADVGDMIIKGAQVNYFSSGDIGQVDLYAGGFEERVNHTPRTIAAMNRWSGTWSHGRNEDAVTITAEYTETMTINGSP